MQKEIVAAVGAGIKIYLVWERDTRHFGVTEFSTFIAQSNKNVSDRVAGGRWTNDVHESLFGDKAVEWHRERAYMNVTIAELIKRISKSEAVRFFCFLLVAHKSWKRSLFFE